MATSFGNISKHKISATTYRMKTRDGSFCGDLSLLSGKNLKFEIGSCFGPEPTSKRAPSQSEKIQKDSNLQSIRSQELLIQFGQETAHFAGNLL